MKFNYRVRSLFFKLLIFISSLLGLAIFFGFFEGNLDFTCITFFTIITNILCMIYFGIDFCYELWRKKTFCPNLKSLVTFGISLTGLIFWTLLSNCEFEMGKLTFIDNLFLHTLVPIFTILDYLLFDKKGTYKWFMPIRWSLLPFLYLVFVVIIVNCGYSFGQTSRYPYFFMDFDAGKKTFLYLLMLAIYMFGIGYLYVFIDRVLSKKNKH